jgi:hypothetical protein
LSGKGGAIPLTYKGDEMKDKVTVGSQKGYTDAGMPTSTYEDKQKQLRQAGLLDTELGEVENLSPTGHSVGGFLKRNNFGDRF